MVEDAHDDAEAARDDGAGGGDLGREGDAVPRAQSHCHGRGGDGALHDVIEEAQHDVVAVSHEADLRVRWGMALRQKICNRGGLWCLAWHELGR